MPLASELLYQQSLKRWSWLCTMIMISISVVVLGGWIFESSLHFVSDILIVAMNPLAAISFLAAGFSLALYNYTESRSLHVTAMVLAVFVLISGLVHLYLNIRDYSIQSESTGFQIESYFQTARRRQGMLPFTAVNFVFTGIALLLPAKFSSFFSFLSASIGMLALFFLTGFFFTASQKGGISDLPMPVLGGVCFALISLALLFSRPDEGFMLTINSRNDSGTIGRFLIPSTIFIPVFAGFITLILSNQYKLPLSTTITFFVCVTIISFLFLYWYVSQQLSLSALKKSVDEIRVRQTTKNLEKKVKESTTELSEYKYAVDVSSIVSITDLNGIILQVNENYSQVSQYTREELIGQQHNIRDPLRHPVSVLDDLWNTISRGRVWRGELMNLKKNGEPYWENTTIIPLLNQDQHPFQYLHIITDITERKNAEEKILALNESLLTNERKLNRLLENNKELITIVGADFNVFYRSPNYQRITGYHPDESFHLRPEDAVHPDDMLNMTELARLLMENPGNPHPVNFRMKHAGGDYMWMEGSATNLLDDEAIHGIVFNIRNVSDRKEAEAQMIRNEKIYRTIAANIPSTSIAIFDTEGRYTLIESNIAEKFGYEKGNLIGKYFKDILTEEHSTNLTPDLERVFSGEKFSREFSNDGVNYISSYVPLTDESGQIYAAMQVTSDVSGIKTVERQVAEMNLLLEKKVAERTRQLEQINRELEAFTYSVSHDLRAPLRIIEGFAEYLDEDISDKIEPAAQKKLQGIRRNSRRMSLLIDDLLKLSGIGKKVLHIQKTDMEEIVHSVIQELAASIQHRFTVDLQDTRFVDGDSSLLRQVWVNLISNAVKYSSKKENPQITIRGEQKEDQIFYSISDNGAGFDPRYAGKLFSVFQRLHSAAEFEGTGIGLALVQRIISRHHGIVWAESKPDEGAVFYFSLPASPTDTESTMMQTNEDLNIYKKNS